MNSISISIRSAKGGYIVTDRRGYEYVYSTLEEVCEHLLQLYEGRASTFSGDMYGHVTINRDFKD